MNVRSEDTLGTQGASLVLTDGSFRFGRLAAGTYTLSLEKRRDAPGPPLPSNYRRIQVSADITGLNYFVGPGATVKGKLRTVGGDLPDKLKAYLSEYIDSGLVGGATPAPVKADGTFEFKNARAGKYHLAIESDEPSLVRFYVSEVSVGGHDATETGVEDSGRWRVAGAFSHLGFSRRCRHGNADRSWRQTGDRDDGIASASRSQEAPSLDRRSFCVFRQDRSFQDPGRRSRRLSADGVAH